MPDPARSLTAILQSLGDDLVVVVEDSPVLVSYEAVAAGGNNAEDGRQKKKHVRNHTEAVLLVHKAHGAFTCNERAAPDDLEHGVREGALPKMQQTLNLESLPNGALDGGPKAVFPRQLCALLIGRYFILPSCTFTLSWGCILTVVNFLK